MPRIVSINDRPRSVIGIAASCIRGAFICGSFTNLQ